MSIERFQAYESIEQKDIPKIPLYMDQVIGWFSEVLATWVEYDTEKPLTKTMINNYVKARLVAAPERKKYNAEQLMQLLMIYHLKNVLSLEDIKRLFDLEKDWKAFYEKFFFVEDFLLKELREDGIYKTIEQADVESKRRYALQLALEANIKKKLAEEIIRTL